MRISDWSSDVCSSDLAADVLQIGERDIGHRVLRLRAFGAAAHVGTDEAPWPGEARRQRLEIAGVASEARQAEQGRTAILPPGIIAIMAPQPVRGPTVSGAMAAQAA